MKKPIYAHLVLLENQSLSMSLIFSRFVTDKYLKWKFRKLSYDPIHPQNLFAWLVSSFYKTEHTELLARGPIGNPRYQTKFPRYIIACYILNPRHSFTFWC